MTGTALTLEYPSSTTSYGSDTTFDIINPREHFLVDIHASGAAFAGTYPNATLTSVTITLLGNIGLCTMLQNLRSNLDKPLTSPTAIRIHLYLVPM